jgi:uncharacterized protein (DUF2062 family)
VSKTKRSETGWRRWVPDPKQVIHHPWLAWLGPRLTHPRLWHINRRGIAMALSIGLFFGLLIPVAQIPLAGIAAVLLRANLPVAVCSTLITNPVTFAPIYIFAYRLGSLLLGDPALPEPLPAVPVSGELKELTDLNIPDPGLFAWLAGWWDSVFSAGKPLVVGLVTMATFAGMTAYVTVLWLWRVKTWWVRRQRRARFSRARAQRRAQAEAETKAKERAAREAAKQRSRSDTSRSEPAAGPAQ